MDITTHPFLNVMWTFFVIFVWISWWTLVVGVVIDIFRNREMSGASKALWFVVVVLVPLLGVLSYVVAHGASMGRREAAARAALAGSAAEEIERAQRLHAAGAIDDAEYQALKARALA